MTNEHRAAHRTFAENLFGLPKELREIVYTEVFKDSAPVPLRDREISPAGRTLLAFGGWPLDPELIEEVSKAYYTYSTFSVRFPGHQDYNCNVMNGSIRCSCAVQWLPEPQNCQYVRNLIIHSQESGIDHRRSQAGTLQALEDMYSNRHFRRCFEQLLLLPRLEQLTIHLEKQNNEQFTWAVFTPILSLLRERSPKFQVSLAISFDALLEAYWSDPIWENTTEPGNVVEHPYDPMGFVDITELIESPSAEDVAYVEKHCQGQVMTPGQDILRGLLDETAPQRRALALHYVVKEPALLRVRIKEHYKVYERMRLKGVARE
ncbi:hypothetical protein E8E12_007201 [Didymella heteroderae]|uniref:Uncharacterized protein n=1 Tax=Didymella heteroderae TaxID=1769908 RepID=A0A9P4WX34_9PLEO|nr:hypothetical protein E8E12_007201 [Didymella heteroderae]